LTAAVIFGNVYCRILKGTVGYGASLALQAHTFVGVFGAGIGG